MTTTATPTATLSATIQVQIDAAAQKALLLQGCAASQTQTVTISLRPEHVNHAMVTIQSDGKLSVSTTNFPRRDVYGRAWGFGHLPTLTLRQMERLESDGFDALIEMESHALSKWAADLASILPMLCAAIDCVREAKNGDNEPIITSHTPGWDALNDWNKCSSRFGTYARVQYEDRLGGELQVKTDCNPADFMPVSPEFASKYKELIDLLKEKVEAENKRCRQMRDEAYEKSDEDRKRKQASLLAWAKEHGSERIRLMLELGAGDALEVAESEWFDAHIPKDFSREVYRACGDVDERNKPSLSELQALKRYGDELKIVKSEIYTDLRLSWGREYDSEYTEGEWEKQAMLVLEIKSLLGNTHLVAMDFPETRI